MILGTTMKAPITSIVTIGRKTVYLVKDDLSSQSSSMLKGPPRNPSGLPWPRGFWQCAH